MKKSLSILTAIAMVFTMFASMAFAADNLTPQNKFDALKAKGIFAGYPDGTAGLDRDMTRAEFARVAALLLELDLSAPPATPSFTDVATTHWAYDTIEADVKAGIISGMGDGTFQPSNNVTIQEMARVLVDALGIEVDEDAEVEGASEWAQKYVAAAVGAGLIAATSDYTVDATRSQLVVSSYAAAEASGLFAPAQAISSISVIGAKKFEVKFASAVDKDAVTVTVKKGTIPVNIKGTTYSDDNKTATIETVTKLTKGDYTVTVTGATAEPSSKTITVDDEKVTKIEITNENAPLDRNSAKKITAWLKITNQYGEDITNGTGDLVLSVSKGVITKSNNILTIDNSLPGGSGSDFILNEKVTLSVVHAASQSFASAVLTVSAPAKVASVTATQVYHADGKELRTNSTASEYSILLDAKDQYGNAITDPADLNADLIVTPSNPTIITKASNINDGFVAAKTVDGKTYGALQLAFPTDNRAGTSTVFFMSNTTGAQSTIDVVVKDVAKVDQLTLSSPELAVAGESIEIPFTAVDQFGNEMNNAADITAGLLSAITVSDTSASISFVQDYVNDKAKLVLDATGITTTSARTLFINAITSTGNSAQLNVSLQPNAIPSVIVGVKDVKPALAIGAVTAINTNKVDVIDQYGRTKTANTYGAYYVKVDSNNGNVTLNNPTTNTNATGIAAGSSTITLKLYKTAGDEYVANSDYNFNIRVVKASDVTGYNVGDVATVYAGGSDYAKALSVTGLLSDGTEVTVPNTSSYYQVTVSGSVYGVTHTADGKIEASASIPQSQIELGKEKVYTIVVTGFTNNGPVNFTKEVTVSKVAPAAADLALVTAGIAKKESDGVVSINKSDLVGKTAEDIANDAVKVTDQYGVPITTGKFQAAYASNFSNGSTIAGVNQGGSFNIAAVTPNGKSISFKIIVK